MRSASFLWLGCMIWVLGAGVGEARKFQPVLPDQLEPTADLICTGKVVSIEKSWFSKVFSYSEVMPSAEHEFVMTARIKMLHTFQGQAPSEFEFQYRNVDEKFTQEDGPQHVRLEAGRRYRFFLKPGDSSGRYVGVLEGKIDDGFDVEELWATEPDDSPYLKKEDAMKIARYVARVSPDAPGRPAAEADARTRLSRQMSDPEKAELADFVIENDGNVETLRAQVQSIWVPLQAESNKFLIPGSLE